MLWFFRRVGMLWFFRRVGMLWFFRKVGMFIHEVDAQKIDCKNCVANYIFII